MKNKQMQEQSQRHAPATGSGQIELATTQKKPFVEPTLSQPVSLPNVTMGSFVGSVSP